MRCKLDSHITEKNIIYEIFKAQIGKTTLSWLMEGKNTVFIKVTGLKSAQKVAPKDTLPTSV